MMGRAGSITEPLHDFLDGRGIEIDILFGKRVDAREGKILRNMKLARELRRGKTARHHSGKQTAGENPDFRIGNLTSQYDSARIQCPFLPWNAPL